MSANIANPSLSAEDRQYYVSTAMLTTAFDYQRDDSEMWWLTFVPVFVSRKPFDPIDLTRVGF